ncbi:ATP-binding cassette sub-family A member 9-like isoform X2 [Eublepharis macularius]|uniref:ATP-binding cassette sub-family A member 9-like isoform X2 n=1 Tax=Eublepharis macularius TaxID=481883 RepID=A0AA97J9B5_EUBMA|nr:ATP-binding cassette sub-family A member 9-like isoform X2 [Eublepharis macularius]
MDNCMWLLESEDSTTYPEMQKERYRNVSMCQQIKVLLLKNIIVKWRMKKQSFQEWFASILLLLAMLFLSSGLYIGPNVEIPHGDLGQLDALSFNFSTLKIAYTPGTKTARAIMEKVETVSVMGGVTTKLMEDEKAIEEAHKEEDDIIGVIFQDRFSYRLRFSVRKVNSPIDYAADIDLCYNYSSEYCSSPQYWFSGFLSLQSSIDAALIELTTGHSVWDEMKSIRGIRMRSPSVLPSLSTDYSFLLLVMPMCFFPLIYFLSQNVSREKRKLKELMNMMGVRDMAFWLSWSLLYAVYILIMTSLLTPIIYHLIFPTGSFFALFLLFFLYGISSIHFCFMFSSLLKTAKATSSVVFVLTFFFGSLSVIMLIFRMPAPLVWTLSLICPFAFGAEISKVIVFQKYGKSLHLSNIVEDSGFYSLLIDSVLYMLLALYFDKTIPDKYGVPYPPLFFLKKSYWFKSRSSYIQEQSHSNIFSDNVEPVSPEFDAKESIRINNIKKTYEEKNMKTEALRGLSLNIYEGQITAILGHSGAGKTTLLNILSGFSNPSAGSATIFKYNITKREDMEEIRKISAVCPQFNVQFEFLTVKENLKTFAKLKGVPSNDVENQVQKLLTLLDMNAIQDSLAYRLSGGQKRKLSLGMTLLGEPQVLLLDEPTAGLDPYSRQLVWALLNERKAGRIILFTTQFMDEADILADRKAFISHGRLKCVGSSLFLKKKWGIGYHLRMHVNEFCDSEKTTSLIKRYIPAAKLSGERENERSYTLPLENVDKFPDLFHDMDNQADLGIVNYGVTMTTLEDVFMKLEDNETTEEDYGVLLEEDGRGADETEQNLLLLSDAGKSTVRGMELWRQQVCAIARMHFLQLKRESKFWRNVFLLFGIVLVPSFIQLVAAGLRKDLHNVELHSRLYFEPGTKFDTGFSGLLILNDTGASIDHFIRAVRSQNIFAETATGSNVSDQLVHNGAIKVALEKEKYQFTLMCHMEVMNCFPVLVNIISNALLRMFNSTSHIQIWNHLFRYPFNRELWIYSSHINIFGIMVLFPAFAPHFAMNSVRDYKLKIHSQLRVSGLFPSAYWCGQALVDFPVHWIILFVVFGAQWFQLLMTGSMPNEPIVIFCFVLFLLSYGVSVVLLLYVVAFIFRKGQYASSFWSFTLMLIIVILLITSIFFYQFEELPLNHVMVFLIPLYPSVIFSMIFTMLMYLPKDVPELATTFTHFETFLLTSAFAPFFQCIIFIFLLRYLEMKYGSPIMRRDPVFRISPQSKSSRKNPEEASEDDDRDVQDERTRVQYAMASPDQEEKPVIIVHNLRKEYKSKKACSCLKKNKEQKKAATRNVSFCVKKGEVWGLLGPNGAGKSTTISMITGDTELTAGQVLIKKANAATSFAKEENGTGFLGYCPQENALWSNLTMREHLEVYAAVKGIRKDAAAVAINRIVQALELQEHLKKATKTLAAGLSRKLCFALSVLGDPTVMLLDEPTTGMDPRGKRQVWKVIHALLKGKDQGAILTTHNMEEAEAMCDRVAIMVSGLLRCLGSIQYLKSKFGKNYLLQIKVKGVEQGDLVNAEILRIFPQAARQERIPTLLVYKIPMDDALPLSKAFSLLEKAKRTFSLEEYSFSLNTLEQVFLELCKDQERDRVDAALDSTFEWKHLQQEDF